MQELGLMTLAANDGFQFTKTFFPYTSGKIGPYYVQSAVVQINGADYVAAVQALRDLVLESSAEVISGGESRDWIFSNPVSVLMGLPHATIYKNGKVIGANMEDKEVAHVADLNNEGSSPRDIWVPAIEGAGGKINHIYFYVDRLEDGAGVMEDLGLKSHAVVPLDGHAWGYLLGLTEFCVLDKQIYEGLMERMEDKDRWARDMLRSDEGFKTLSELARNPDTAMKVRNILDNGYPDLKDELSERLGLLFVGN